MSKKGNLSNGARQYKSASKPRLIALEPRMLFDGAAVATVVDATKETQNALTDASTKAVETNTSTPNTVDQAADTAHTVINLAGNLPSAACQVEAQRQFMQAHKR